MPKWEHRIVAAEILRLSEAGQDLSYSGALRDNTALFRAAVRLFGSWHTAVQYAGLEYDSLGLRRHWDRDTIIEEIRRHALQGADLSWSRMREMDPPLVAAARKPALFGSWQKALDAAGVPSRAARQHRTWDEEAVVTEIRKLCAGRARIRASDAARLDPALLAAARRRFGSWSDAVAISLAGITIAGEFGGRR